MSPIFPSNPNGASVEAIDRCLPQTLCRQCGFEDCVSYAEAIATGAAPVNRCAPGGAEGIRRLCAVTGAEELPLDPEYGHEAPFAVAKIRAAECIGCAWCVRACPTDAIVGSAKRLHAVDVTRCTGCARCAPACPMDCIDFVETGTLWTTEDAERARLHHEEAFARSVRRSAEEHRRLEARRAPVGADGAKKTSSLMADILAMARKR